MKFEFGGKIGCGRISVVIFEFGEIGVVKFVVVEFGGGSASGGSCLLAE